MNALRLIGTGSVLTVVLLCNLVGEQTSEAATYYTAKTGNDSNTCPQARSAHLAKLTVGGGLACMASGDTLIIKAGVYAEPIDQNQVVSGSSWSSPTVIKAAPGETVTLQPVTAGRGGDAVWFYGRSYVVLDGLIIDAINVPVQGIRINNGTEQIRLQNLEVKNAGKNNCIGIQDAKSNSVTIINSKVHDCGSNNHHHGIYLRGSDHVVEGNEIYNNFGYGVHQWNKYSRDNNNNVVRYNYIHDNGSWGILIGSGENNLAESNRVENNGTRSRAGGITVGFHVTNNNQVSNNTIYSNRGNCILIKSGSTNSKIDNNTCWQNGDDTVRDEGILSSITKPRPRLSD